MTALSLFLSVETRRPMLLWAWLFAAHWLEMRQRLVRWVLRSGVKPVRALLREDD